MATSELSISQDGKVVSIHKIQSSLGGTKESRVASISFDKLRALEGIVISALQRGGSKFTSLVHLEQSPITFFAIQDSDAEMLALIFLTVGPLSRTDKIEAIARKISEMHPTDVSYWLSSFKSNRNARKALRASLT